MSLEEALRKIQDLELENENLKLENNSLKKIIFGSKREKTPKNNEEQVVDSEQCSLFDNEKEADEHLEKQEQEKIEEITVYRKKKNKKKQAGIKRSALKDVVIEKEEYVLNEEEKCPVCNEELKVVGKEEPIVKVV